MVHIYYPSKHRRDQDVKRMKNKGFTVTKIEPRISGKGKNRKKEYGLNYK